MGKQLNPGFNRVEKHDQRSTTHGESDSQSKEYGRSLWEKVDCR